jgi:hypothetical protein
VKVFELSYDTPVPWCANARIDTISSQATSAKEFSTLRIIVDLLKDQSILPLVSDRITDYHDR